MVKRLSLLLLLLLLSSAPAYAPIVKETYTQHARMLWSGLSEVSRARELSPADAALAERIASTWVYVGPCKGTIKSLSEAATIIETVNLAKPSRPFEAAILEMIAIMIRQNLGRTPSDYTCRFALETAEPLRP